MAKGSTDIAPPASEFELRLEDRSGTGVPPEYSSGDFDIRIGRDGTWYREGSPIGSRALVKLFASVLTREGAGDFWLATPVERGVDAPVDGGRLVGVWSREAFFVRGGPEEPA